MPGDLNNERIPLVEFNTRALVHSTQHGQGNWLGNANIRRPSHHVAPPQLNVSPSASPTSYSIDGTNFSFNTNVTGYVPSFPKSTPDIYVPPTTRPEGPIPNINNLTNPDTRANALGFTKRTVSYDFEDSDNPEFVYDAVVESSWGRRELAFLAKILPQTLLLTEVNLLTPSTQCYLKSRKGKNYQFFSTDMLILIIISMDLATL